VNLNNAKDYLPLVQGLAEGRVIQYKYQKSDKSYAWMDLESCVDFCVPAEFYRIKPEPREIWVNEYPNEINSAYRSYDLAAAHCLEYGRTVRYREVIE
jgi:hypothetical protein